jgi:hypothetical protein
LDVAWFQPIISGKSFDPGSNWRTPKSEQDLTIECGELYRSVSKLPVFDPWMIFCCNAMRSEVATTDLLIFDDSKASLLSIHYALPRHQRPPPNSN